MKWNERNKDKKKLMDLENNKKTKKETRNWSLLIFQWGIWWMRKKITTTLTIQRAWCWGEDGGRKVNQGISCHDGFDFGSYNSLAIKSLSIPNDRQPWIGWNQSLLTTRVQLVGNLLYTQVPVGETLTVIGSQHWEGKSLSFWLRIWSRHTLHNEKDRFWAPNHNGKAGKKTWYREMERERWWPVSLYEWT